MSQRQLDVEGLLRHKAEKDRRAAEERRREKEREEREVAEQMKEVEENPPERLEDWPKGKAMFATMGGPEHESSWEEGPTRKLGPSEVRFHEGGDVTVHGEKVDDPDEFKSEEPVPDPIEADSGKTREDRRREREQADR